MKKKLLSTLIGAAGVVVTPQLKCDEGNIHHPATAIRWLSFLFMPQLPLLWPGGAIQTATFRFVLGMQVVHSFGAYCGVTNTRRSSETPA
jgi:hypothetical protein